jgi:hypothetical protein
MSSSLVVLDKVRRKLLDKVKTKLMEYFKNVNSNKGGVSVSWTLSDGATAEVHVSLTKNRNFEIRFTKNLVESISSPVDGEEVSIIKLTAEMHLKVKDLAGSPYMSGIWKTSGEGHTFARMMLMIETLVSEPAV